MLVNLNDVLKDAQEKHYAVGLFNTTDTDMLEAAISAAEEMRSPIIIGTAYQRKRKRPCAVSYVMRHPPTALAVVLNANRAINPERFEYGCHSCDNPKIYWPDTNSTRPNTTPTTAVPITECNNTFNEAESLALLEATIGKMKALKAVPK